MTKERMDIVDKVKEVRISGLVRYYTNKISRKVS
jgi:hypothetical protein